MRLLTLPAHLRAWGLTVVETDGWKTRGTAFPRSPSVVVAHHTATPSSAKGDMPTLRLLVEGRSDLPGPLSQLGLGRSGTVYVIASGRANHAGKGSWDGVDVGNTASVGIEAEHPGGTAPWPAVQLAAYDRLAAALLDLLDQPSRRLCGHKESAQPRGRKVDPNLDMSDMRHRVGRLLTAGPTAALKPTPPEPVQEDTVLLVIDLAAERVWQIRPWDGTRKHVKADVLRLLPQGERERLATVPNDKALAGYKVIA